MSKTVLYLLVVPGCKICEAKAALLKAGGTAFVEVNANTLFRIDGKEVSEKTKLELVTELAWRDQTVPLEVKLEE